MPEFRVVDAGTARIRVALEGEGPLALMVHGFPESWYSWRHQIGPIAAAGFTACAIDVRGYGGSQKFSEVADFSMENIVADVRGVADALSPGRPAVLIGHDWGAPIVYNSALIHPDRFTAVVGPLGHLHRRAHPLLRRRDQGAVRRQEPVLLPVLLPRARTGGGRLRPQPAGFPAQILLHRLRRRGRLPAWPERSPRTPARRSSTACPIRTRSRRG